MRFPNFLVIGAAKSGTSSLYHYLNQHPQIYMCPIHEPNFFALEGAKLEGQFRGPGDWEAVERSCVRDLGQYIASFADAPSESCLGEISPLYFYSPHSPVKIREHCPEVKLIAILRHPADRAFSNFRQYRKAGIEPIESFKEALEAEEWRIREGWGPWPFWHYQQVGFYARQLQRYIELFPSHQIFIGLYDELQINPSKLMRQIFAFIGVDDTFTPNMSVQHNLSARSKSPTLQRLATQPNPLKRTLKRIIPTPFRIHMRNLFHRWNTIDESIPPELRFQLNILYQDDILRLQTLIHRDLSHWAE